MAQAVKNDTCSLVVCNFKPVVAELASGPADPHQSHNDCGQPVTQQMTPPNGFEHEPLNRS